MKLIELLLLIEQTVGRVKELTALARRLREEGRDELTPEEVAALKANDDAARQDLVDAIERAQADGR